MDETKILICVVLFNQDIEDCNSYKTLLKGYNDVIVIDNSTIDINNNRNISDYNNWKYLRYPNNPGLSFAYNAAAKYAKENGYNWMMLSDQDTCFEKCIVDNYKSLCKTTNNIYLFCPRVILSDKYLLSPVKLNHYFPKISKNIIPGNIVINPQKFAIINSGMLISIEAFYKVGGYNENVFLDFSDFQFIEKFGYYFDKVYVSDSICIQEFSNQVEDIGNKLNRFKLFCRSLKHFQCNKKRDKVLLYLVVLKRAISLSKQFKILSPYSIILKEFFQ